MKSGTTESMKFMVLKAQLRVSKYAAIGILEGLWALTATSASDGAIGRFSNIEIASWMEWDGDADELIDALIKARFVDECEENRLVIHDWAEHAPTYIKGDLSKHGKDFAVPKRPAEQPAKHSAKQHANDAAKDGATKSSQAKSSQVDPKKEAEQAPPQKRGSRLPTDWALPDDLAAWAKAERPDLDIRMEADRFRDYWAAKPGKDGVKLDWPATWRNWVRNAKNFARAGPQMRPRQDRRDDFYRQLRQGNGRDSNTERVINGEAERVD